MDRRARRARPGRLAAAASAELDDALAEPRAGAPDADVSRQRRVRSESTESRSRIKETIIDSDESRAIVATPSCRVRQPVGWRSPPAGTTSRALDRSLHSARRRRRPRHRVVPAQRLAEPELPLRLSGRRAEGRSALGTVVGPRHAAGRGRRIRRGRARARRRPDPDEVGFQLFVPGRRRRPAAELTSRDHRRARRRGELTPRPERLDRADPGPGRKTSGTFVRREMALRHSASSARHGLDGARPRLAAAHRRAG